ncbi:MAG TPA: hypothetical protein VII82_14610 [Polyangiaceae bacterium]
MKLSIRSIARTAVFVAAVAFVVQTPRRAFADDLSVRVSVKRAADAGECPDASRLAAAIARAGRRAAPSVSPNADARLRFDVEMARSAAGYVATVRMMGARIGVREIEHTGATCAPLGDALAVALVVVIDDVAQGDAAPRAPDVAPPSSSSPPADTSGAPPLPPEPPSAPPEKIEQRDIPPADLELVPSRAANNSFFVELGGSGLFYTFNYERIFGDSDISLRVGFGYVHLDGTFLRHTFNEEDLSVPAIASYYIGSGSHRIQIGLGGVLLYQQSDGINEGTTTSLNVAGVLGYRYLPLDGGVNFGISFTPCFRPDVTVPWGGIDFGVGF